MPATADEITLARSYIGPLETEEVFNERYDRLGPGETSIVKLNLAIEESMRAQLANLIYGQPTQITVGGDSFNWSTNVKALRDALEDFINSGGIPDPESTVGIGVARLHRLDVR